MSIRLHHSVPKSVPLSCGSYNRLRSPQIAVHSNSIGWLLCASGIVGVFSIPSTRHDDRCASIRIIEPQAEPRCAIDNVGMSGHADGTSLLCGPSVAVNRDGVPLARVIGDGDASG